MNIKNNTKFSICPPPLKTKLNINVKIEAVLDKISRKKWNITANIDWGRWGIV